MSKKRLSENMGLEIINVQNGEKYGYLGDCEMTFDSKTGEIKSIIVNEYKESFLSFKEGNTIEIPWSSKVRQSDKTIIFDYDV